MVDEQAVALKLDALANTHPIEVTINHPDEIRTIFDAISYEKGASVLQMLKAYLGDTAFRDGLRVYLKQHAYGNAETADLWAALEKVSGKPVTEFMSAWTGRPGYPLLRATANQNQLELKQTRFYLDHDAETAPADEVWPVPLLAKPELSADIVTAEPLRTALPARPLLLNQGRTGFYRVSYDADLWEALGQAIQAGQIQPLDRLGLLSDAFETAKAVTLQPLTP